MKIHTVKHHDNGLIEWFNEREELDREDGPAAIYFDGSKYWLQNGEFHRDNGPAIIHPDGRKYWYKNGKLHREDGPAMIWTNGSKFWYLNDEMLSKGEFDEKMNDNAMIIRGKRIELSGETLEHIEKALKGE